MPARIAASRSARLRSRWARARACAFGSTTALAGSRAVAIDAFGLSSRLFESDGRALGPRRRASQSFTQSGGACAVMGRPSARIHISASECLQGNLRLGQVHLYPRSDSEMTTRYGCE